MEWLRRAADLRERAKDCGDRTEYALLNTAQECEQAAKETTAPNPSK